jgi:hypothetical protein
VVGAVFKTVVGREERPGCVRFARASAMRARGAAGPIPGGAAARRAGLESVRARADEKVTIQTADARVHVARDGRPMNVCRLREALGEGVVPCDESGCPSWMHLGFGEAIPRPQCAVEYFDLLGAEGLEVARWLLALIQEVAAQSSAEPRMEIRSDLV